MSMQDDLMQSMTGMPSGRKRVRRGGGRHKAKPDQAHGPHAAHHAAINAAMAKGDHAAAKSSALMLAKALHKLTAPKSPTAPSEPAEPTEPTDVGAAPMPER